MGKRYCGTGPMLSDQRQSYCLSKGVGIGNQWQLMGIRDSESTFYHNDSSGRSQWKRPVNEKAIEEATLLQAALCIQRSWKHKTRVHLSLLQLALGLRYLQTAPERYTTHPTKVASMINYALYLHAHTVDYASALQLYHDALLAGGPKPLLLRCMGLVHYALENNAAGHQALLEASLLEKLPDSFNVALDAFFTFAALRQPSHVNILLNLALIYQYIYHSYDSALQLFQRALFLNEEKTRSLYTAFQNERLPGRCFEHKGPSASIRASAHIIYPREEDLGLETQKPIRWEKWQSKSIPETFMEEIEFWYDTVMQQGYWKLPRSALDPLIYTTPIQFLGQHEVATKLQVSQKHSIINNKTKTITISCYIFIASH